MFSDLKVTDIALSLFTFLLVLVGVGQVAYLGQANDVARRAANIADEAAKAASVSADIATQTLRKTQRAFISVNPPPQASLSQKPFNVQILATNEGATPAHDVSVAIEATLETNDNKLPRISDDTLFKNRHKNIDIFPHDNSISGINAPEGFTQDGKSVSDFSERKAVIYGSIFYTDEFGVRHFSHFCGIYDLNKNGGGALSDTCPIWNDSD